MPPVIPIESFSIFATNLDHPECLAFDRAGTCFAGGEAGQLYAIPPQGGPAQQLCHLGGFTAGIALTPDDSALLVCNPQHGLLMIRKDGSHTTFATHAGAHKLLSPNFPLYAPDGSLYVTDSGNWNKRNGLLLRFTPDGKGEVLSDPMGYTNGLALLTPHPPTSPSPHLPSTLYMVESDTNSIHQFSLTEHHAISPPTLFATNVGRLPDGLTLDPANNLLCSCYASDDLHRFPHNDPAKKELLAHDPFAILLSRPTNVLVRDNHLYASNLGRTTITRAPYIPT